VAPGSVVWVGLDGANPDGLREIERLRPHLWVASGAGQHLYWRLRGLPGGNSDAHIGPSPCQLRPLARPTSLPLSLLLDGDAVDGGVDLGVAAAVEAVAVGLCRN
jgi:hypothetical protein